MSRTSFLTILIISVLVFVRSQITCQDPNCKACPYSSGRCEMCNTGYNLWGFACVTTCPDPNSAPSNSRCSCKSGYYNYAFSCIPVATQCPNNLAQDNNGFCNYQTSLSPVAYDFVFAGTVLLYCPPFSDVGIGLNTVCMCNYPLVANPYTATCETACPTGMQADINYNCVCPTGKLDSYGTCVTSCPANSIQYGSRCHCGTSYVYDMAMGMCVNSGSQQTMNSAVAYASFVIMSTGTAYCNYFSSGSCASCSPRYYKDAATCTGCQANCWRCTSNTVCTMCSNGYTLIGGTCSVSIISCAQSTSTTTCTTCPTPNILQSGSCAACTTPISQGVCVSACPSATTSISLSNNQVVCVPCSTGCQYCSTAACIICSSGYTMNSNGTCTQCLPNCTTCSNGLCLTCNTTYYLSHNGSCVSLPANCATGTPSGDCVTCLSGMQWNNGNCVSNTSTCSNGTYFNNSMCNSCSTGCALCTNGTSCVSCSTGFTLNSTSNNCTSQVANSTVSTMQSGASDNNDSKKVIAALVLSIIGLIGLGLAIVGVTTAIKTINAQMKRISNEKKYEKLDTGHGHMTSPSSHEFLQSKV